MPSAFRLRGFHPLRPAFPYPFRLALWSFSGSPYPGMLRIPVWALSIPLAATLEITFVFFSSGYLDVSVRRVPLHILLRHSCLCSSMDTRALPAWVSPFRHLRIIVYMPLPAAFRSLSRLSSALSAKASALCSSLLDLFLVLSACLAWQASFTFFIYFFLLLGFLVMSFFFLSPVFGFQGTIPQLSCCEWRLRDSNSRPPACKAGALPAELSPRFRQSHKTSSAFPYA